MAGSDITLQLTGAMQGVIAGEGKGALVGHIEVAGFRLGGAIAFERDTGLRTRRRSYEPVVVEKYTDRTSPLLWAAMANNEKLTKVKLASRKQSGVSGGLDFYTIELKDAYICQIKAAHGGGGMPMEEVSFVFTRVMVEFDEQRDKGGGSGPTSFSDEWSVPQ